MKQEFIDALIKHGRLPKSNAGDSTEQIQVMQQALADRDDSLRKSNERIELIRSECEESKTAVQMKELEIMEYKSTLEEKERKLKQ